MAIRTNKIYLFCFFIFETNKIFLKYLKYLTIQDASTKWSLKILFGAICGHIIITNVHFHWLNWNHYYFYINDTDCKVIIGTELFQLSKKCASRESRQEPLSYILNTLLLELPGIKMAAGNLSEMCSPVVSEGRLH